LATVGAGWEAEDVAEEDAWACCVEAGRAVLMPPLEVDAEEGAEVVDAAGKVAGMNNETMFASRWRSVSSSGASDRFGGIG